MHFSLASVLLALAATVSTAPADLERRAAATCGSQYYSAAQVNAASVAACNHFRRGSMAGSSSYPHRYNNYEGFNFQGLDGPYQEFPILPSGIYTGGSPGPDRVVITEASCRQAGTITHTGASGNNFVACSATPAAPFNVKEALLDDITAPGSFAGSARITVTPPVDVHVHGIGPISLPWTRTRHDRSSASAIRRRTGMEPIKAELYKMLIYSQGAMFKPHTDLPSPHTGGEVIVKHCGKPSSYKTSEMAQSLITWYSDVIHELRPVTSGHRWVLTYNLALAEEPNPEKPLLTAGLIQEGHAPAAQRLRETTTRWLDGPRNSRYIYHVLDHDYTEAQYSLKALKSVDRARTSALKQACEDLPVDLFLALLEKEEMGSVEFLGHDRRRRRYYDDELEELDDGAGPHALQDISDTQYRVKTLFDFDGTLVSERLGLSNNDLTTPDIWYDVHDCEEAYEGYMGNSGPSAIHWYHISAIAIVPRDSLVAYFLNYDPSRDDIRNMNLRIEYFARSVLLGGASASILDTLMDFCYDARSRAPALSRSRMMPQFAQLDGDVISSVLKVALQHDRHPFFLNAVNSVEGDLAPEFFDWVRQWLSTGNASSRFERIKKELKTMIDSYPRFASRHAAITKLVADATLAPPAILAWARETLAMFIYKAWSSPDDERFAMPTARIMAFALAFMARLSELRVAGTMPEAESMELYAKLADRMVNQSDTFTALKSRSQATTKRIGMDTIIDPEDLARLFSGAVAASIFNGSRHVVSSLVAKITREAPFHPPIELYGLWIPRLALLPPILQTEGIPVKDPPYQQLYQALMVAAVDKFVGEPPSSSNDLPTCLRDTLLDQYDDIVKMRRLLTMPTKSSHRPPPATPGPAAVNYDTPAGSQIAGTKRKTHLTAEDEVVDLLSD
ncbi:uncharacterized protein J7T54_000892 [Emericellopsis cladophorae]|uniref:Uncharacterized protein n=1 Tax=Emericellopsis cladophorae TaxID=2686198 RepID=A0A9Q0BFX1_9HYPO|nr:uncharacterized protein J7T54_000892 [Emericellopsis cladophorae]KAI6782749.1 hypothetical protein J7T54_000892 [Emericellopsis cladophorae]